MSQNFFNSLNEAEQYVLNLPDEEQNADYLRSVKALSLLKGYVFSCAWCNTEKTRLLMRNIRKKAVDVAEITGVSANTVRSARSQASKKLFSIFGSDVFDGIKFGDKKVCNRTITIVRVLNEGYSDVENYIPDIILRELEKTPAVLDEQYDFPELKCEVEFIRRYSLISMMKNFNSLDMKKLRYLFGVLNADLIENNTVNIQKLRILGKIM